MNQFTIPTSHRGATLIEVMVSLLIVAFGVLAMIALQTNAVKFSKTSEYRSIATLLANDLADRMRVNQDAVTAGSYTLSTAYSTPTDIPTRHECADVNNCTTAEMATRDLDEWRRALLFSLPGGNGFVQPVAGGQGVDVWIAWVDPGDAAPLTGSNGCPAGFQPSSPPDTLHCIYFRIALGQQAS
ncbi:MAG: type IV pilus modification protein PilV [Rubrivivax sp.]|nr:MAG: type IV pilus modification protein PilV [Rubrivivax sp.]